jgi:hypothetical protein
VKTLFVSPNGASSAVLVLFIGDTGLQAF